MKSVVEANIDFLEVQSKSGVYQSAWSGMPFRLHSLEERGDSGYNCTLVHGALVFGDDVGGSAPVAPISSYRGKICLAEQRLFCGVAPESRARRELMAARVLGLLILAAFEYPNSRSQERAKSRQRWRDGV